MQYSTVHSIPFPLPPLHEDTLILYGIPRSCSMWITSSGRSSRTSIAYTPGEKVTSLCHLATHDCFGLINPIAPSKISDVHSNNLLLLSAILSIGQFSQPPSRN